MNDNLLRLALRLDAAASGGLGLVLLGAAPLLDGPLGLSTGTQRALGLFLVVWAAVPLVIGMRPVIRRGAVWAVLVVNALWAIETAIAILADVFPLTAWGVAFLVVQAVAVLALTELQWIGLRRAHA
jgi:hypothetical protein